MFHLQVKTKFFIKSSVNYWLITFLILLLFFVELVFDSYTYARQTLGEKRSESYLLRDLIRKIDYAYLANLDDIYLNLDKKYDNNSMNSQKTANSNNDNKNKFYYHYYKDQIKPHINLIYHSHKLKDQSLQKLIEDFELKYLNKINFNKLDLFVLRSKIIEYFKISTHPKAFIDYNNGKKLYLVHCKSCHGQWAKGDGILAKRFVSEKKIKNYLLLNSNKKAKNASKNTLSEATDKKAIAYDKLKPKAKDKAKNQLDKADNALSLVTDNHKNFMFAHQIYNLLLTGMPSGAMSSLEHVLNDHQLWNIAFYTISLLFDCTKKQKNSAYLQTYNNHKTNKSKLVMLDGVWHKKINYHKKQTKSNSKTYQMPQSYHALMKIRCKNK